MGVVFNKVVIFSDMDIYYIVSLSDKSVFKKIKFPYSYILKLLLAQIDITKVEELVQYRLDVDVVFAKKLIQNLLSELCIYGIILDLGGKGINYKTNILSTKDLLDLIK